MAGDKEECVIGRGYRDMGSFEVYSAAGGSESRTSRRTSYPVPRTLLEAYADCNRLADQTPMGIHRVIFKARVNKRVQARERTVQLAQCHATKQALSNPDLPSIIVIIKLKGICSALYIAL
ncbi:hypothetical protein COLO4_29742 [Corchorus olitorius]|uniref:Uncharacterized protein n=1 Tax=Corchorus olitorius TaxID=93759 RepID=A0A1R3HDH4_9ROSI|nr:hypothetical protein COLO4_29742 [Corchorus olitorius]